MNTVFIFVISLFIYLLQPDRLSSCQQLASDSVLVWCDGSHQLFWNNFQGQVRESDGDAGSYSNAIVDLVADSINDVVSLKVYAVFYSKLSWTKFKNDSILLMHEQLHFDISELVARSLRKKLRGKLVSNEAIDDLVIEATKYITEEMRQINTQYDLETDHGRNIKEQMLWNKRIEMGLDSLSEYGIDCSLVQWE